MITPEEPTISVDCNNPDTEIPVSVIKMIKIITPFLGIELFLVLCSPLSIESHDYLNHIVLRFVNIPSITSLDRLV